MSFALDLHSFICICVCETFPRWVYCWSKTYDLCYLRQNQSNQGRFQSHFKWNCFTISVLYIRQIELLRSCSEKKKPFEGFLALRCHDQIMLRVPSTGFYSCSCSCFSLKSDAPVKFPVCLTRLLPVWFLGFGLNKLTLIFNVLQRLSQSGK